VCEALSLGVPAAFAIARSSGSPQWDSDLAVVRDVALLPVTVGGAVSSVLTQALSLAPLGPIAFRAALVSALAAGLVARQVLRLSLRLRGGEATPLDHVLGALAALTVGLSPAVQALATVAGSPLLGTALALAALVAFVSPARGPGRNVAIGALTGLAFVELPATLPALAILFALATLFDRRARRAEADDWGGAAVPAWRAALRTPEGKLLGAFGTGLVAALLVVAFLLLPIALRPHAVRTLGDATHVARAAAGLRSAGDPGWTVLVFATEVGWFASAFVALGVAATLVRTLGARGGDLPRLPLVLVSVVAIEAALPLHRIPVLSGTSQSPLRPLAIAALGGLVAFGLRAALRWIEALAIPAARSVQVLVVVLQTTLLALTTEEAALAADRTRFLGAEAWTDEALVRLDPKSAVYARTPSVAWRLYAAQLASGARPDVLVVPAPLLGRPSVTEALRAAEPASLSVLRDVSLTGNPSEYALSLLADARPLHVETDRDWPLALRRHLSSKGLWVGYAPQPLGPSDRKVATQTISGPAARFAAALAPPNENDPVSASRFEAAIGQQVELLDSLKEREAVGLLAQRLGEVTAAKGGKVEGALGGVLGGLRARAAPPASASGRARK